MDWSALPKKSFMRSITPILFVTGVMIVFQNCAPQHSPGDFASRGDDGAGEIPILESATQLLTLRCAGCHSGSPSPGDPVGDILNIEQLTALNLLVPGNPSESELYISIVDGTMPIGGTPLTLSERDLIFQWIVEMQPSE